MYNDYEGKARKSKDVMVVSKWGEKECDIAL